VRAPVRVLFIAVACLTITAVAAADALQAPPAVTLTSPAAGPAGWIALTVGAPPGATVTLSEVGAAPFATVTMTAPQQTLTHALAWRCDRRVRRLEADALAPDGTRSTAALTVHTPSCAGRFALAVRPRTAARVGRRLTVTVADRWKTGGTAGRVCLRVRGAAACRAVTIPRSERGVSARLEVSRAGLGAVTLSGAGFRSRERLETRRGPLRLLATGDSMIQIIDSLLAQRLEPGRQARVTSDAHISTGISKPFMFDWPRHARAETARVRPQATVMFIGANDGFPIGRDACCTAAWVHAYARRVAAMMRDFRRGGDGRVYWLTIPAPRDPHRRPIYAAVNRAVAQAAAGFAADEVSVIDLVRVFTPGGVYRAAIHGRVVRQADGIHLNVAGAKIAARVIVRRLRADGLVG
jgi:lysophospholipase L1-like esterase